MSNIPPHFNHPTEGPYHDHNFSDPYLSAAGSDPDETSFMSSGIIMTPSNDGDHNSTRNASGSPLNFPAAGVSTPTTNDGYTHYPEFLSPTDGFASNPNVHTSPATDFAEIDQWQDEGSTFGIPPNATSGRFGSVSSDISPQEMTMNPSQLLTPVLTNNPSPSSEASVKNQRSFRPVQYHQPLTLITIPQNDSLGVNTGLDSARAVSPIIKVENYSQGDSPVQNPSAINRQPSQSSGHLSPGGMSSESEEEGDLEDVRPIQRTHKGSWLLNQATGHGGLEPRSRGDVYVHSPNEVESHRKLDERNADIYTWSEAVSVAHSEAGDEPPLSRGRTDHHGTRRRAKSAGDPSLQQDYFSLYHKNTLAPPGPGLLLNEPSENSEDGTDSPAVSVERYMQEDTEIAPPINPETDDPLPSQFLSTRSLGDTEHNSSPIEARNQPQSSSAAMVDYQKRARDFDAASRWATWGTGMDDKSIKTLTIRDKDATAKKHERQNSLLKRFTKKPTNNLKRAHQPTDLSVASSQVDEIKPSPQRKDSFPRKLSLSFSPKSPGYNTGGAIINMTKQMAAIGGNKDTLQVTSPTGSATSPWSFKARGRSRSELPRKPGLFELMTSHGGPPAPIIALAPEPAADNDGPQHAAPALEPDIGDDDENDDDLNDERGLVMDFPILPNLPVPTLEGFKTQVVQLNPRLASPLVERFAIEQLRRYRKLIETKQGHAQDVSHKKCKAGRYCFAQGGQAKLLPPRTSPHDTEFAHTQFQIPGRGEADDAPQALGETAITTAQFPPGVPFPPSQVTKLPAEFECPVCFQVKKFQKPSDWTKHIYEDVQPFTCTFPHCTDPKSFKRKADWVRHESERHRQLEWWECSFQDCRHRCYRKDNFVQHLVREHKMPEPKVKKTRNKGSGRKGPFHTLTPEMQEEIKREQQVNQLWDLVETCRHDTPKDPKEEPCRFCGNVCSSWKKLTVHLAKHMEQIAIPILGLVNERDFSSNSDSRLIGEPDPASGQMSVVHKSHEFAPSLNGLTDGSEAPMNNFTQAPYTNRAGHIGQSGSLGVPLTPTYLATSMALHGGGLISAEPESVDPLENGSSFGPQTGLSGFPAASGDQRLMPMHQTTASTYPPPYNAGPRPRVSNQDLRALQNFNVNNYSMSPTEMHFDPQNAVYVSPTGDNNFNFHFQGPMAPSAMPFNPSEGYRQQP